MKKFISLTLVLLGLLILGACNNETAPPDDDQDPIVNPNPGDDDDDDRGPAKTITIAVDEFLMGYHDPEYKDPITEDYPISGMDNYSRDARRRAIANIEDEFNVKFEFVTYPDSPEKDILTSVLANDPIADLVHLDGQSKAKLVVPQNVLQDISDLEVVNAPENAWMMNKLKISDMILGFSETPMGLEFTFVPMVFNVTLLESCPAAMDIGYPTDLWQSGDWTWDTLNQYFAALKTCGQESDNDILPYAVADAVLIQQAGGSNGAYVVDNTNRISLLDWEANENGFNGYETTLDPAWGEALDLAYDYRNTYGYSWQPTPWKDNQILPIFSQGQAYFAGLFPHEFAEATTELTKRGHSMALVPFPKGPRVIDGTAEHDYNFLSEGGDAFGVPKGVSEAQKKLAVESYIALIKETYIQLGYSDDNGDFDFDLMKETHARKYVTKYFDVDHPEIGDDLIDMYNAYYDASQYYNPMKSLVPIWDIFYYISNAPQRHPDKENEMRKKIWTGDGYNVPAQLRIDEPLAKILSGEDPTDVNKPTIVKVEQFSGTNVTVNATDNLTSEDFWKQFFVITDDVTKPEDITVEIDLSNLDPDNIANFVLTITATDAAGNANVANFTIHVNTEATE